MSLFIKYKFKLLFIHTFFYCINCTKYKKNEKCNDCFTRYLTRNNLHVLLIPLNYLRIFGKFHKYKTIIQNESSSLRSCIVYCLYFSYNLFKYKNNDFSFIRFIDISTIKIYIMFI